ncbi:MAG TPA: helix-turn-helix domain-containing protein [Bryobacteraceae bacterium]|nr:helix-turn-helix domain-containing protein [Bryobacteraceae bacterium]
MNFREDIPAAVPSLIDAAVTAFDADRDASRRYLFLASALLRVKCGACAHAESAKPSESRGGLPAWQLNRVVDYIETHLAEKMMVTDLADLIDVSVGHMIRAFKVSVGVPPFHYIVRRRVELACTMMSTTRKPLSQIAIACGMCDQAHLSTVFRRMIGMSPLAWRREQEMSGVDNMRLGMDQFRRFAPKSSARPFREDADLEPLSDKEEKILQLISEGMINRKIANVMCLAEGTVKNYVSRILEKRHANTRTELALLIGQTRPE